jgi:hypothetical protein
MVSNEKIWNYYFTDFIAYKLKFVGTSQEDIAMKLLNNYFRNMHLLELPRRMVHLHCHASVHHISLAKLVTLLRPLSKIEGVRESTV